MRYEMNNMAITTTGIRFNRRLWTTRECSVCGSPAVGINFGALTCAPCKAFFRRNARRREVLEIPCYHSLRDYPDRTSIGFAEIRRCSSCRLIRCFAMGMREELVRTDEQNARYKQLVDANRQRKEFLEQNQRQKYSSISQFILSKQQVLNENDWRHLSNIVSAYDTFCLNTYIQRRGTLINSCARTPIEYATILSMNLSTSLYAFLRSLSMFQSLSRCNQIYLCKNNFFVLLFPNFFELKQTCFSEPWQISLDKTILQWICGSQLYEQFLCTEALAEKYIITDPVVTRLWLLVLFFSPSLSCTHFLNRSFRPIQTRNIFTDIRNTYITLLWKYLLHRYGHDGAVRIYVNLIFIYMKMQNIASTIGIQIQTRPELMTIYQTIDQFLKRNIRNEP